VPEEPHPKTSHEALEELHDSIYREKVLRARSLTPVDRFDSGLELSKAAMQRMLEGAMWQLGTDDPAAGWQEVRRRMQRLRMAHDHGFYSTEPRPQ